MQEASYPFHHTTDDGVDHFVKKGDVYDDGDPILKGREALFKRFETKSVPKPARKS